uniref:Odorant binding protein 8 n=1 Tax=Liriomyza sativae TaxID=127406 RepID=A0A0X8B1W6_LIRSA|nr:odorant binding protein 8 [Liriomyza sativae]
MKVHCIIFVFLLCKLACAAEEDEMTIINSCLERLNNQAGGAAIHIQQVENYSSWTVEKIPCFTVCIARAKGWFNADTNKWNKHRISEDLGADTYNYCRYELDRQHENACHFAHQGMKCLKQAQENIPITHAALLGCVLQLNITLDDLRQYVPLQLHEKIPCFFQCFAQKMQLYSTNFEWNTDKWVKAFGPPHADINEFRSQCKASSATIKSQPNTCAWMYTEHICLERMSYHKPLNQIQSSGGGQR